MARYALGTDRMLSTAALQADSEDHTRMMHYAENWDMYKGEQWKIPVDEGEVQLTLNYIKAVVDKSVSFLFGKGFRVICPNELKDTIGLMLQEAWEDNDKDLFGIECGQMGAVSGDAFIKTAWEIRPEDIDEGYENGRPRVSLLPSSSVFPKYDPHDRNRMIECIVQYAIITEDASGKAKTQLYQEIYTATTIDIKLDEISQPVNDGSENPGVYPVENPLKEIPISHVRNLPMACEKYGISDMYSVIGIQQELNEKSTDVSDIINYHAAPVTIITGGKAGNLVRGARKVWSGLPKDAKVYNLELHSDLNASNAFITALKTALHELTNTPEDSLGQKAAISNTSGVALQIKYSPLMEKTWIKRLTYGKGLRQVNRLLVKFYALYGTEEQRAAIEGIKKDSELRKLIYRTKINWPDPLPKDEEGLINRISKKMSLGLEEPEGALSELGFEGDVQDKLKKIDAYLKRKAMLEFDANGEEEEPETAIGKSAAELGIEDKE